MAVIKYLKKWLKIWILLISGYRDRFVTKLSFENIDHLFYTSAIEFLELYCEYILFWF